MKNQKQKFYTLREIHDMGFLPYKSIITLRRLVARGVIKTVRNPSERSFIYVPESEVARLKKMVERRQTQDASRIIEKK